MSPPTIYIQLSYDQYKELERQLREFASVETAHTSTGGFYHKAIRLRIPDCFSIEFHGPLVKAAETVSDRTMEDLHADVQEATQKTASKPEILFDGMYALGWRRNAQPGDKHFGRFYKINNEGVQIGNQYDPDWDADLKLCNLDEKGRKL